MALICSSLIINEMENLVTFSWAILGASLLLLQEGSSVSFWM